MCSSKKKVSYRALRSQSTTIEDIRGWFIFFFRRKKIKRNEGLVACCTSGGASTPARGKIPERNLLIKTDLGAEVYRHAPFSRPEKLALAPRAQTNWRRLGAWLRAVRYILNRRITRERDNGGETFPARARDAKRSHDPELS